MTASLLAADAMMVLGGVCLFLVATMAIFAGRCATIGRPPEDECVSASVLPAWLRSWWRWMCSPLVRACLRLGIPAEAVALLGVTASAFAAVAAVSRSLGFAGWMYLSAASLAGIGAQVARMEGRPGRAAALLDGSLGRLAELMMLGALVYTVRDHEGALVAGLFAMGATMLTSDARLRSEAMGAALSSRASWFGRSERALLIGGPCALAPAADALFHRGASLDILAASLVLVAALGAVSAVRRIHTAHEALRTIDALSDNSRESGRRLRLVRGGRV
ncbi:MAG TPA: hypothetical protein VFK85_00970 [Anaeromyxobacteraceae bacterium]|nr:hypothetical protein [Anaeromyxobacteraceae bacterium]